MALIVRTARASHQRATGDGWPRRVRVGSAVARRPSQCDLLPALTVLARASGQRAVKDRVGQQPQQPGHHAHLPGNHAVAGAGFDGPERPVREVFRLHEKRHAVAVLPGQRGVDIAGANGDHPHTACAQLTAQGYTENNDVEFEDGTWTADAKSADGNHQEVRIDGKTGKVYPEDVAATLTEDQVKTKLADAGYTKFHDFTFKDGVWTGKADDPTGKEVEIKADPADGHIIGAEGN